MSSTGRGRERLQDDEYLTPTWTVDRVLEKITLPGGRWLEPCAGEGNILATVLSNRDDVTWAACEVRKECLPALKKFGFDRSSIGDFLKLDEKKLKRFDVVFTNPPYALAEEFLDKCMRIADHTVFLLRINFLGSEERAPFFDKHMPDVYQLPNRPCFQVFISDVFACPKCPKSLRAVPEGTENTVFCNKCGHLMFFKGKKKTKSDSTEYAWFHFYKEERDEGRIKMLNTTPLAQRR